MTNGISLRADALKNRERILAAAEDAFLENGAGVSLDDVAKRAGVGIGTLYRRFPTREELLAAAFSARFLTLAETSRARDAELDPLESVRAYLVELVRHTNVYRGLAASLGTVLETGTPGCLATTEEGTRLLQRAQAARVVRSNITFNDIVCIAVAISLATENLNDQREHITHLAAVFIDGIGVR
ncbi:TetR family transcriptional regulator [Rhizobium sp. Leaf391]|uniref:TetR/AcrR family transcriptional regulator n=1 Tax=Rhizobium sp. Leaf391 TaxID=1736360 RepID=UPI000714FD03|nr:TetR/AcrR family transcriptional regulator [Rhizobium sp. Leaf391]KQT05227.1 TetR family transcriptional regulator [Rhizobium sp. Leaf391]